MNAKLPAMNACKASRQRPPSVDAPAKMYRGAAANSFASTPIDATTPAVTNHPVVRAVVRIGPSAYISGSDVYGSCSVYKPPNPAAVRTHANEAAGRLKPTVRHHTNTPAAAAALQTTEYAFHLIGDGPGSMPSTHGTSTRKQWRSLQS